MKWLRYIALLLLPLVAMGQVTGPAWTGGNGTSGQCLTSNGVTSLPSFQSCGGGGSDTVTSVAFADGSTTPIYTITGSPITTSGTLTQTFNTQAANYVLAGPTTGAATEPTFRALVNADIPTALSGIAISGATGSFTTLAASSTVSGTGFSAYLASPPAIGGTAPAAVSANNLELAASQSAVGNGFYNGAAGNQVNVSIGGSNIGDFTSTGLNSMAVGASTASTGAFTALTTTGIVGMTGAAISLNASSNFNVNICSGSCSGSVTLGNGNSPIGIVGSSVSVNASSNHNTSINTGTSTGTITIGNSSNTGLTTVANMAAATVGNDYVCATTAGVLSIDTTTCGASDEAFKEKIKPLTCHNNLCIDEVMKLRPVSFHFKASYDPTDKSEHIGFLAQDMEKVEPRLVAYDAKGKPSGVDYAKTSALLAKGEQDLQAEVVALRAQNATLESRLLRLEHAKK